MSAKGNGQGLRLVQVLQMWPRGADERVCRQKRRVRVQRRWLILRRCKQKPVLVVSIGHEPKGARHDGRVLEEGLRQGFPALSRGPKIAKVADLPTRASFSTVHVTEGTLEQI